MQILKGGHGAAMRLAKGQRLRIVNTHGSQVVDIFAHNAEDLTESLSIQHSRNVWYRLQPKVGDQLWTQLRRPILTLEEDSSPGVHDTLFPCCDAKRYLQLGVEGYHRNCADNWREALTGLGITAGDGAVGAQPLHERSRRGGRQLQDPAAGQPRRRPGYRARGAGLHRRPVGLSGRHAAAERT